MKIAVPKESAKGERRIAATPDTVRKLIKLGFEVAVEAGAGVSASLPDGLFAEAGATIVGADAIWAEAELVLKVRPPSIEEVGCIPEGASLISLFYPAQNGDLIEALAARKITVVALDQVPRISRAQKMDVLSSMANIAGYRAVIEAANHFGSFFGGQITAAGRTRPAQVMVVGAGVAGLAAIAAARGLGAEVRAFDVRPAAKEQVESLGARFLDFHFEEEPSAETAGGYAKQMSAAFIEAELAFLAKQAAECDIIITTALIPGKKAPQLITKEAVAAMRPGSIVVDMAAEQGGNCAHTQPDRAVQIKGVTILGYTDLTSRLATHASQFFGTNLFNLLKDLLGEEQGAGGLVLDMEDEVVRKSTIINQGVVIWPPPPDPEKAIPPPPTSEVPMPTKAAAKKEVKKGSGLVPVALAVAALALVGLSGDAKFAQNFTVFVLACFVGWQVVWSVTPALHTPLMSVTNAISGIIVVGGMLQAASGELNLATVLGAIAVLVATINISGGFLVTRRMLAMFQRGG